MLEVALVTWFPRDPSTPKGGVEAVSVTLADALSRRDGWKVHVVTLDPAINAPEVHAWNAVTVHRLPRGGGGLLPFARGQGKQLIQSYLRMLQPDVVHSHDTFGIMTQGLDLPRVFTIHGFIHEDTRYRGGLKARLRAWLWKRAELAAWSEQPHIISISPYVRERLRGIAKGVIHDIENPIDNDAFSAVSSLNEAVVFGAAAVCERKNVLGVVRAIEAMKKAGIYARLRWAGSLADGPYEKCVNDHIREKGLADRVEFLGQLPASTVRGEMRKASIFALVSFEEGAPMGIAEAMAAGLPVVTSNRCGMPYMVESGRSGYLVDPHDPVQIGSSIGRLLTNADLRRAAGNAAREKAEKRFRPAIVAERTIEVYDLACSQRSARVDPYAITSPRTGCSL